MGRSTFIFRGVVSWVLVVGVLFSVTGCRTIRNFFVKPPPEGVVQESHTARIMGYEQTVTLKTTPKELIAFLSDIDEIMPPWTHTGKVTLDEKGLPVLGSTVPFSAKAVGVEVKGRFIVLKSEWDKAWFIWDNPRIFMTHRWEFKKVKEGVRLTLNLTWEVPYGGRFLQLEEMLDYMTKVVITDIDIVLARIQARFDPSLVPEELVAAGFRGNIYETFLQVHETRVWINAPPEEVEAWIREPENNSLFIRELDMEKHYLSQWQQAPTDVVVYIPAVFKSGILRLKTDLFFIEKQKGTIRVYSVASGRIGFMEVEMKPGKEGTLTKLKMVFEIPTLVSSDAMDLMLFLTRFPQFMQEKILLIKKGMGKTG